MNEDDVNRSDMADLESTLRRALLPDGGQATGGENRVLAKVQGYVRDNPRGARRDWSRLLLTIGAIGVPAAAAAAIAGILVFGHATIAGKVVQPAGSPPPTASPSPTVGPAQTAIVEISRPANGVGPETVHWVAPTGTELAATQLPDNEAVMGAGGTHVLVYRADGHVLDLHPDGTADVVGSGMPVSGTSQISSEVPVRVLVSPDGTQWIWGQITTQSGNTVTSQLELGGIGAVERVVAQAVEANHALEPYRWALANPLIVHDAMGVGGYILFNQAHGQVDQLDLASGQQSPIGAANSGSADVAGNGAKADIYRPSPGAAPTVEVNGPGLRGLTANLPATGQAGGLMFDPSSNHLVFATSPANNDGHESFTTSIVDLNTGARTTFGPANLRPATWLRDGRLVEFRTSSDGDGNPGTYVVGIDGAATKISIYSEVVGFAEVSLPTASCQTSSLEVATAMSRGAAGTITQLFEVRNKSQVACVINGYFGAAAVNGSGHVFVDARRAIDIPAGTASPPHDVLLPPNTAALNPTKATASQDGSGATPGHAYFFVSFGHGCNGGAPTGADRWQLIPPDQTQPIVLATSERVFCSPVVTPVDDTPTLKPH
ncbi:MAG TPA: DUF4232 domain-containing protein [Candidatus Solibacter sp.]|jgi:hypothetical protein|nr:DUF4232 domain-containing protein [Candidatus Solibacter sp.]